ncbi:hypothetical protein ACWOFR_02625 [Carnobacterium gallinarum]|uniref:hypothetical protein n=1 Tax=Carnobacterium gallinarum TaxID=2749 RepID=UPI00054CD6FA|nr:hypothetical protein [Carnobacterium gallinarum]
MKKDQKILMIILSSFLVLILITISVSTVFYMVFEAKIEEKPTLINQEKATKSIDDFLLKKYNLVATEYDVTKTRLMDYGYQQEFPPNEEKLYKSTVTLKDPAVSFTVMLDSNYEIYTDSFVLKMTDYYLKPYLASYQTMTDYLKKLPLHSSSYLINQKTDNDFITIQIDFENKKFNKILLNLLKEKRPLDFKQLFQDNHYVAWITFDLYTEQVIDENNLKQIEFDLKNTFNLIPQTYSLYLQQVDFSEGCDIHTDDDYSSDDDCLTDNYYFQEFRGGTRSENEHTL